MTISFDTKAYADHLEWLNANADTIRLLLKNMFKCPATFPLYAFESLATARQVVTECVAFDALSTSRDLFNDENLKSVKGKIIDAIQEEKKVLTSANLAKEIGELLDLVHVNLMSHDRNVTDFIDVLRSVDNVFNKIFNVKKVSHFITSVDLDPVPYLSWPDNFDKYVKFMSATLMIEYVKLTLVFLESKIETESYKEVLKRRNDIIVVFMIHAIEHEHMMTFDQAALDKLDLKYCTLRFGLTLPDTPLMVPTIYWKTDKSTTKHRDNLCIARIKGLDDSNIDATTKKEIQVFFKFLNTKLIDKICIPNLLSNAPSEFYKETVHTDIDRDGHKTFQPIIDLFNFVGNLKAFHKYRDENSDMTSAPRQLRGITFPKILAHVVRVKSLWMISNIDEFIKCFKNIDDDIGKVEASFTKLIDEIKTKATTALSNKNRSGFYIISQLNPSRILKIILGTTEKITCNDSLETINDSELNNSYYDPNQFDSTKDYEDLVYRRKIVTETVFRRCYENLDKTYNEEKKVPKTKTKKQTTHVPIVQFVSDKR
jgi:hypothetical protein